ncbi:MAG TPA: response regulator [Candidatus Acidoferrum sp.]|nr:response regulator [Candidatus Acidoferrum sp.]
MDTAYRPSRLIAKGENPRLMVADDAPDSRAAIADYFLARGYDVILAVDGVQALSQTIRREVDIIIMSATLPGLEGYEAAAILRKINPRIQIILTAGADIDGRPRESQRMERFRCFPKPLNLEEIAWAIEARATGSGPETERTQEGGG